MADRQRYLKKQILADLARKMVFVAGPRQVGKTTLARALPGGRPGYLNWDDPGHRERILKRELPVSTMWVFDEKTKWSDADPDRGVRYIKARFPNADAWQISAAGRKNYVTPDGIRIAPAIELLSTLV